MIQGSAVTPSENPVIAILGVPSAISCTTYDGEATNTRLRGSGTSGSCFTNLYPDWIQSAGARAIGIPHDAADNHPELLATLLDNVNGVLFTGGGLPLTRTLPYYRTAGKILDYVQANKAPALHATCMGFQMLHLLVSNNFSVLQSGFDSEDLSLPLDFTATAKATSLFQGAPDDLLNALATQNITSNLHHSGVPPTAYKDNPVLSKTFNVISTNKDRVGRAFVSTVQAWDAPISANQWHPERPIFEWNAELGLNHSEYAIEAGQYMVNQFLHQARANGRDMLANATLADLAGSLITYHMTREAMTSDPLRGYSALLFTAPAGW